MSRAVRLAERTAAKVAAARITVPTPVASDETVVQFSVLSEGITQA